MSETLQSSSSGPAPRGIDGGRLFGGLVMIAVGALFLAQKLDLIEARHLVRDYWPMFVVLIGMPQLFRRDTVGSGVSMILIGAWMQVSNLGLYGFSWHNSWPLLLIAVGMGMTVQSLIGGRRRRSGRAS